MFIFPETFLINLNTTRKRFTVTETQKTELALPMVRFELSPMVRTEPSRERNERANKLMEPKSWFCNTINFHISNQLFVQLDCDQVCTPTHPFTDESNLSELGTAGFRTGHQRSPPGGTPSPFIRLFSCRVSSGTTVRSGNGNGFRTWSGGDV